MIVNFKAFGLTVEHPEYHGFENRRLSDLAALSNLDKNLESLYIIYFTIFLKLLRLL